MAKEEAQEIIIVNNVFVACTARKIGNRYEWKYSSGSFFERYGKEMSTKYVGESDFQDLCQAYSQAKYFTDHISAEDFANFRSTKKAA